MDSAPNFATYANVISDDEGSVGSETENTLAEGAGSVVKTIASEGAQTPDNPLRIDPRPVTFEPGTILLDGKCCRKDEQTYRCWNLRAIENGDNYLFRVAYMIRYGRYM